MGILKRRVFWIPLVLLVALAVALFAPLAPSVGKTVGFWVGASPSARFLLGVPVSRSA